MQFKLYLLDFIIIVNIMASMSFVGMFNHNIRDISLLPAHCECNERTIYRQYLLGLRRTRKLLQNISNFSQLNQLNQLNQLVNILNFTNNFIQNNTIIDSSNIVLNTTQVNVKNIIMGNIVLDVSNIKEIHISTFNDKLVIELDKQKKNMNVLEKLNNIDTIIGTLSLLGKITNMN